MAEYCDDCKKKDWQAEVVAPCYGRLRLCGSCASSFLYARDEQKGDNPHYVRLLQKIFGNSQALV